MHKNPTQRALLHSCARGRKRRIRMIKLIRILLCIIFTLGVNRNYSNTVFSLNYEGKFRKFDSIVISDCSQKRVVLNSDSSIRLDADSFYVFSFYFNSKVTFIFTTMKSFQCDTNTIYIKKRKCKTIGIYYTCSFKTCDEWGKSLSFISPLFSPCLSSKSNSQKKHNSSRFINKKSLHCP